MRKVALCGFFCFFEKDVDMMNKRGFRISELLLSLFFLLFSSLAFAESGGLTLTEIDVTKAPTVSVYFDMRSSDGLAITGLQADQCKFELNGRPTPVLDATIKPFKKGNLGVAVLFLYPNAKNYIEEDWALRSTISSIVNQFDRSIDMLQAISYDSSGHTLAKWTKGSDSSSLASKIAGQEKSNEKFPNLFTAIPPAVSALKNIDGVSQKYLVLASDCNGGDIVADPTRANKAIQNFTEQIKKAKIIPIIIGYTPDEDREAMPYVKYLQQLAENTNGVYYEAIKKDDFVTLANAKILDRILNQNIYEATVDANEFWLDEGSYKATFEVVRDGETFHGEETVNWPALEKNRSGLWIGLGIGLGVLLLGILIFVIIRRRGGDEPEGPEEPVEQICPVCSRKIPEQLMGFRGEFCLQGGGVPDCPYYTMPDQGKIQITRGPLADCTFFIKQQITTIGSNVDNNVYFNDKTVSRKHAAIKMDEGKRYELRDFGSSNGTFINNEKVERKFLRDGDLIRFGTVETVFKLK